MARLPLCVAYREYAGNGAQRFRRLSQWQSSRHADQGAQTYKTVRKRQW